MSASQDGTLRVIPLGGLGEIGLNCLILEYGGQAIGIDCGLMFPDTSMLGVDLVIPDLDYVRQLRGRFLGFVMTHGHEDHIGALPYALRDLDVPVFATPMAAGLIEARLREHELGREVVLRTFRPRQRWELGPFVIDPIHVTHSIVDAVALAITTPLGVVVHSGDFKIDPTPIDGRPPDIQALADYGSRGVLLLLSDSTNAEVKGSTGSERLVRGGMESIFFDTPGKILFSTFSSHVHRIQQVLELSAATGRRVVIVGRSLLSSVKIAMDLGHLSAPASLFADSADLAVLPPNQVTVLTSGSQGEPLSALTRIAMNDHPHVRIAPGDAVVLSSRRIPGNERTIDNMINHLYRRGALVYHSRNANVHVSGHASQDELATLLSLIRPRHFVPVHGEYRHLAHHLRLAHAVGLSAESTFLLENGDVLSIDRSGACRAGAVAAGRVFVDGKGIGDVGDVVLRDRRHLSQDGLLLAVLVVSQQSGELIAGPDFLSRGVFEADDAPRFYEAAREIVIEALEQIAPESRTDSLEVTEEVRKALRRYLNRTLDRRPVVLPVVMEM